MWSVCSAVNGVGLQSQRGQQYQVERAGGVGVLVELQSVCSAVNGVGLQSQRVGLQSQRGQQYQVERAGGGQQYQVCASSVRIERAWTCNGTAHKCRSAVTAGPTISGRACWWGPTISGVRIERAHRAGLDM